MKNLTRTLGILCCAFALAGVGACGGDDEQAPAMELEPGDGGPPSGSGGTPASNEGVGGSDEGMATAGATGAGGSGSAGEQSVGVGGSSGSANVGAGGSAGAPAIGANGSPCDSASDCNDGLTCLGQDGADFFGGGPAGGLCALDCSTEGQPKCTAEAPGTFCVVVDDKGTETFDDDTAYCFEQCQIGGNPNVKCSNRSDMACFETDTGEAFCQPACNGDHECGDRICDLALGVCVDSGTLDGLLPIGAQCDINAEERQCQGLCLQLSETFAVCSGTCASREVGCGADPASQAPYDALCALSVSDPEIATVGDLGLCMGLCDCDDDCGHPDAVCDPIPDELRNLSDLVGRAGVCWPREAAVVSDGGVVGISCGP